MGKNSVSRRGIVSTFLWILAAVSLIASASAQTPPDYPVPLFRSVDAKARPPDPLRGTLKLLVDDGFPPFHYRDEANRLTGLNIEIAAALCSELKVRCETQVLPFPDLLGALDRGEGDVIISALRLSPQILQKTEATRPFYRALGRFAAPGGSVLTAVSPADLAGKRIATIAGSAHEAWLKRYYPKSTIISFASQGDAQSALQSGAVDVLFDDALRLIYWVKGESAGNCCRLVGGAFVDEVYFSQPLSFLIKQDRPDNLQEALDWGLDRLQANGTFATIFRRYVPLDPWAAMASASQPTASSKTP